MVKFYNESQLQLQETAGVLPLHFHKEICNASRNKLSQNNKLLKSSSCADN